MSSRVSRASRGRLGEMPTTDDATGLPPDLAERLARWEDFKAGFERSRKGNLWRRYGDRVLTVFKSGDRYKWSISDADGPRYSRESFEREQWALVGLFQRLEGLA